MVLESFSTLTFNNKERGIQVYVSQNYDHLDQQYPVLYMHDGLNVFRDNDTIGGLFLGLENYLDEHR